MYYFVKSLPIMNKAQLEMILKRGQFRKECYVYRGLFQHLKNEAGKRGNFNQDYFKIF